MVAELEPVPLLPPGVHIQVDGRLDEDVWKVAPSYADWVQKEPDEGTPAINDTRVWLLYDDEALYVGVINYDDTVNPVAPRAEGCVRRDLEVDGHVIVLVRLGWDAKPPAVSA